MSYISTYKEIRHQKSKINKKITIPINLTKYMKWKKSWKNTNYTKIGNNNISTNKTKF